VGVHQSVGHFTASTHFPTTSDLYGCTSNNETVRLKTQTHRSWLLGNTHSPLNDLISHRTKVTLLSFIIIILIIIIIIIISRGCLHYCVGILLSVRVRYSLTPALRNLRIMHLFDFRPRYHIPNFLTYTSK
jgi:hypothetical protein